MENGKPILKPILGKAQQDCVDVLTDALEEAIKGRISSLGIIVCMDDGIATVMAGQNAGSLNLGCDKLKREIFGAIFEDRNAGRSRIMRVP